MAGVPMLYAEAAAPQPVHGARHRADHRARMPRHGCRHQARENFLLLSEDDDALKAMDFGLSVWDWEVFRDIAADKVPTTSRPRCSRVMLYTSSLLECRPFGRRTRTASSRQDFVVGPRILSKRCSTSINPKERLTAFHVLNHPWIKQDADAPDTPLDNVVLNRLKQFRAMNQFKKATLIQGCVRCAYRKRRSPDSRRCLRTWTRITVGPLPSKSSRMAWQSMEPSCQTVKLISNSWTQLILMVMD